MRSEYLAKANESPNDLYTRFDGNRRIGNARGHYDAMLREHHGWQSSASMPTFELSRLLADEVKLLLCEPESEIGWKPTFVTADLLIESDRRRAVKVRQLPVQNHTLTSNH